jgi:hypothetical protein
MMLPSRTVSKSVLTRLGIKQQATDNFIYFTSWHIEHYEFIVCEIEHCTIHELTLKVVNGPEKGNEEEYQCLSG